MKKLFLKSRNSFIRLLLGYAFFITSSISFHSIIVHGAVVAFPVSSSSSSPSSISSTLSSSTTLDSNNIIENLSVNDSLNFENSLLYQGSEMYHNIFAGKRQRYHYDEGDDSYSIHGINTRSSSNNINNKRSSESTYHLVEKEEGVHKNGENLKRSRRTIRRHQRQRRSVIIQSEAGPIETSYNMVLKKTKTKLKKKTSYLKLDDDKEDTSEDYYDDTGYNNKNNNNNNGYNDNHKYVATTPRIIGSTIKQSDLSNNNDDDDDYYSDENDNNHKDEDSNEDVSGLQSNTFFENAKNILDIFTALNTAWNTMAIEQQKSQQQQQQQQQQQKLQSMQIKDVQDQKLNGKKDNEMDDERLKRDSSYNTSTTIRPFTYYPLKEYDNSNKLNPINIVTSTQRTPRTIERARAEGRYIKGDPLKGYYDFVITEGSYKFWAAFQLATAILVIYSTFAAIYYSKVNPLVGDYDYIDYLGGARSLTNTDDSLDFVDDVSIENSKGTTTGDSEKNTSPPGWISTVQKDWIPRLGHSVKFILEAIDKIPAAQKS